jgi:hypothetical protein
MDASTRRRASRLVGARSRRDDRQVPEMNAEALAGHVHVIQHASLEDLDELLEDLLVAAWPTKRSQDN